MSFYIGMEDDGTLTVLCGDCFPKPYMPDDVFGPYRTEDDANMAAITAEHEFFLLMLRFCNLPTILPKEMP